MKIFQTVQKHLASIGYRRNERSFNNDISVQLLKSILYIMCQWVYLLHIANTPKEYMDSIFMSAVGILVNISFLSTVLKMKTIFIFIDAAENAINTSEMVSYILSSLFLLFVIKPIEIICYNITNYLIILWFYPNSILLLKLKPQWVLKWSSLKVVHKFHQPKQIVHSCSEN